MSPEVREWDIFISYAREDQQWVREHIYEPLCRRRTEDGRAPAIFFDVSRQGGIRVGQDFVERLAEALDTSRLMVPVYSPTYFAKRMCVWELKLRVFDLGKPIAPVLIAGDASVVPPYVRGTQFLQVAECEDWFDRLCDSLGLRKAERRVSLVFDRQPRDTSVNHTLAPVCVELREEDGALCREGAPVALSLEGGSLQGTVVVESVDGRARFEDLSISTVMRGARLTASGNGLEQGLSQAFDVLPSETQIAPGDRADRVEITADGEAVFFAGSEALAILGDRQVRAFAIDGGLAREITRVDLSGPLRAVHRRARGIVLAEWSGRVHLIGVDGRSRTWAFDEQAHAGGFVVPGDVAIDGEALWLGMWNGHVARLTWDGEPEWVHRHTTGVARLAAVNGVLCFADMDGCLYTTADGSVTRIGETEPALRAMKAYTDTLTAVGKTHVYHVDGRTWQVLKDRPPRPLQAIADVFAESECPVVIDREGRGAFYDRGLGVVGTFRTTPGARPIAAADDASYCVFLNPDGSRTLLDQTQLDDRGRRVGRIVFSHVGGALSVAPDSTRFAIGEAGVVRVLSLEDFRECLRGPADDD